MHLAGLSLSLPTYYPSKSLSNGVHWIHQDWKGKKKERNTIAKKEKEYNIENGDVCVGNTNYVITRDAYFRAANYIRRI
jgi:hypothetical protein